MKKFRGIFGILVAPFDDKLALDVEDVKSQVEFCVKGGVHGIVVPVNASEYWTLSETERKLLVKTAVECNAGRLPIVAGVSSQSMPISVELARHAKEVGADAVIAAPPTLLGPTADQLMEYYKQIAGAAELPVFIQNHTPPFGVPISAPMCMEIVRKVDGVQFVKEETQFSSHMITSLNELGKQLPDRYLGTFGGKACRYLIDEHSRGALGCMPACQIADVMALIWDLLDEGKKAEAEKIFLATQPQITMEFAYGMTMYKNVLKYRGIIKTANFRGTGMAALDEQDQIELRRVIKYVEPYFRV
ncbi:MAG: dihydrodipicolinate synthase family protein [Eubacteriales bacterium]|nr:dihydrodipicolinate synthase family protein [Eubacteriales bacterium]